MIITAVIITVVGVIALVLFLEKKCKQYSVSAAMTKSLVSFMFMAVAIIGTVHKGDIVSALITLGLLFGLLGDIFLDLKFVHRSDEKIYTVGGFKVFAFGHVLYIIAMLIAYADFSKVVYIIIPLVLGVLGGFLVILLGKPMKLDYGEYEKISRYYGMILLGDTFLAVSLAIMHSLSEASLNLMALGLILFTVSDLVLSNTYFGTDHEKPIDFILNYVSYYAGQFLVAWSLLLR